MKTVISLIKNQYDEMVSLLKAWVNTNSGTSNIAGLNSMVVQLKEAFSPLEATIEEVTLPPRIIIDSKGQAVEQPVGKALRIAKRPDAPIKVLLGGHMDTVYDASSPFQNAEFIEGNKMRGPGAADMKGGLVIMLSALKAVEKSRFAGKLGWEVIINPDEEVGSTVSESLFILAAKDKTVGLLFEPAFSDGSVVNKRKGSANFTIVARGRAAHAGRDFHVGRNAISAIARCIVAAELITDLEKGITINIGHVEGGGPVNIIPDQAICRLNVRMEYEEDMGKIRERLHHIVAKESTQEGFSLVLYENAARLPKPFDEIHENLFMQMHRCAEELDMTLTSKPSGGVCDGNILYAAGLPSIDTMGVVGGNIHTAEEYCVLDSLVSRTKLTALFLIKLANGEIKIK